MPDLRNIRRHLSTTRGAAFAGFVIFGMICLVWLLIGLDDDPESSRLWWSSFSASQAFFVVVVLDALRYGGTSPEELVHLQRDALVDFIELVRQEAERGEIVVKMPHVSMHTAMTVAARLGLGHLDIISKPEHARGFSPFETKIHVIGLDDYVHLSPALAIEDDHMWATLAPYGDALVWHDIDDVMGASRD